MIKSHLILVVFLLASPVFLKAQKCGGWQYHGKVGITFSSFGNNEVFRSDELLGAASISGDYFYTMGISYALNLNKWLEAETGLEYSKHHIIIKPSPQPDVLILPQSADLSLLNIPVTMRANFLDYFFINGGLIFDIDIAVDSPVNNQTGIGAILGCAIKYDFDSGVSAFLNPYTKVHSLVPFTSGSNHQRIRETGFRIGITYNLSKI